MLTIRFDNLAEIREVYSPDVVNKATKSTVDRLTKMSKTAVSREIRRIYSIKSPEVNSAMTSRTAFKSGEDVGYILFKGERLSLSRFTSGGMTPTKNSRPAVKTRRGKRYGARVRIMKQNRPRIVGGAVFWGKGRKGRGESGLGQGAWQIWRRDGKNRNDIRRLTAPSIPQMASSQSAREAPSEIVRTKADAILADRLNFYSGRRSGVL